MSDIFDPEGEGYDDVSAVGMRRNAYGHMGSVKESTDLERRRHGLPMDSYLMLKGKQHKSWHKAVEAENERGYRILKRGGRYWSVPEDYDGDDEEPFLTGEIIGKTKQGRPIVKNIDGTSSTELRVIVEIDGEHMVIPTMFGGKQVSIDEAIDRIVEAGMKDPETGREIRGFATVGEARAEELRIKAKLDVPENYDGDDDEPSGPTRQQLRSTFEKQGMGAFIKALGKSK